MGAMTAAMLGMGALSAGAQMWGGIQSNAEGERNAQAVEGESQYNAGVYRQQGQMVEQQKNLKASQDARKIRFAEGTHTAITAAKGIQMSGSAVAVLTDTLTQMELDKAITSYNYDVEKHGLESQAVSTERQGATLASQYRSKGRNAMTAGIVGGLTTFTGSVLTASARLYKAPNVTTSAKAASGAATDIYDEYKIGGKGAELERLNLDAGAKFGGGS